MFWRVIENIHCFDYMTAIQKIWTVVRSLSANNVMTISTAAVAIIAVVSTIMAHNDTKQVLSEQQRLAAIQHRAYLSHNTTSVIENSPGNWTLILGFLNSGQTPAYDVKVVEFHTINGVNQPETLMIKNMIIDPGQNKNSKQGPFSLSFMKEFTYESGNRFNIRINYKDYTGAEHQRTKVLHTEIVDGDKINIIIESETEES